MTPEELAIVSAIVGLLAVGLGWVLNELSTGLRRQQADRDALGSALAELLEIRHRLRARSEGSKLVADLMRDSVPIDDELMQLAVNQILDQVWPELADDPDLSRRFNGALDRLSGSQPLLAYKLRRQELTLNIGPRLHALSSSDEDTAKLAFRFEHKLGEQFVIKLEEAILRLASYHGRGTKRAIQHQLGKPLHLPEGFANVVREFATEIQRNAQQGQ